MTIEDMLLESHESLVEGITVLLLKMAYDNKLIKPDEDVQPHLDRVTADVENWLATKYDGK